MLLSQNKAWEGIVHHWASNRQIIQFLDKYLESDHYAALSNHEQLSTDVFVETVKDTLAESTASAIVYEYIQYRLGDYGWELED